MLLFKELEYKVFCDMDGVLVDFNKGYHKLTGIQLDDTYHTSSEFWDPINEKGQEFWSELEWTEDGKELWDYISKTLPVVLSAPSRNGFGSRKGKVEWCDRELPKGVKLILAYSKHKKKHSGKNRILIDDRKSNIDDWIKSGGIGILHTSTKNTIEELKKLGI